MTVIKTYSATDPDQLEEISGWAHDALLVDDAIDHLPDERVVEIRFEQEPLDPAPGLPRPEEVGRSWWSIEYRMPFVLCRLRVRGATGAPAIPADTAAGPGSLLGIRWDATASRVRVELDDDAITVPADALDVRLDVTDEVVSIRRRRVGRRIIRFDSTRGPL